MPLFVLLCLILAVLVQIDHVVLTYLVSPWVTNIGCTVAVITIIACYFDKLPEMWCYDLASSSILITWFSYWKPMFVEDSPIFFFFPVYFALLMAFISLFFVGQKNRLDVASKNMMQSIVESKMIEPWFAMLCVLITLYFEDHFLQYPVFMTLLSVRYALSGCLQPAKT